MIRARVENNIASVERCIYRVRIRHVGDSLLRENFPHILTLCFFG